MRGHFITKTRLFKYTEIFTSENWRFSDTKKKKKKKKKTTTTKNKKTLIFFIILLKTDCGYSLELPRRGGSYEYPQSMFSSKNKKKCLPLWTPVLIHKSWVWGGGGLNYMYIGMFSWWIWTSVWSLWITKILFIHILARIKSWVNSYFSRNVGKRTFVPVKLQISLCIRAVWSESLLRTFG